MMIKETGGSGERVGGGREREREGESESEKNQQILWWWRIITVREKETEQRNTRVNFTKVNTKKRYSHAGDSLRFAEEQKKLIF